jgi:hypothetical protein
LFVVFTLLILFPITGCQKESLSPTSVASEISTTEPPIENSITVSATETATPTTEESTISVAQGKPLAIDGTMSPGEWDGAAVETFSDGSELFLMYSGDYLYLAIRASIPEMIVGNVFINRGDEISILHASAALGTALYRKGVNDWQQEQDFAWCCIKTDQSAVAQAEREAFLQEEHWVAANARMGTPNELEYQIEVADEILRLAVTYIKASNPNVKIPWPLDLEDDCITPTPGGLPGQLNFSPDEWAVIRILS